MCVFVCFKYFLLLFVLITGMLIACRQYFSKTLRLEEKCKKQPQRDVANYMLQSVCRGRERERERQTDRKRERQRDRQRLRQREGNCWEIFYR